MCGEMGRLTSAEALTVLQIQPQKFYANVSQARIRAPLDRQDSLRSLYRSQDAGWLAGRHIGGQWLQLPPGQLV